MRDPNDPAWHAKDLAELRSEVRGWLRARTTVAEAETRHTVKVDGRPVPFGLINRSWLALVGQMRPGDELWEFHTPPPPARPPLAMREGFVVLRGGEVLTLLVTRES